MDRRYDIVDQSKSALLQSDRGLYFCGLFVSPSVDSTCCDITRASLATAVAFSAVLLFPIPDITVVVFIVLYVVRNRRHVFEGGEITRLKNENLLLNLESVDSIVRAGCS